MEEKNLNSYSKVEVHNTIIEQEGVIIKNKRIYTTATPEQLEIVNLDHSDCLECCDEEFDDYSSEENDLEYEIYGSTGMEGSLGFRIANDIVKDLISNRIGKGPCPNDGCEKAFYYAKIVLR